MAIRVLTGSFPRASAGTPISTTSQSFVSYTEPQTGRTFTATLNGNHDVGVFVNGIPFIVSASAGSITGQSPTAGLANSYEVNGCMKDPYLGSGGAQGWDGMLGVTYQSTNANYSAGANIAPGGNNGANGAIAWSMGDEFSLVWRLRQGGVTDPARWDILEATIEIHIVPEAPLVGTFSPPPGQLAPKTYLNIDDLNYAKLRSLTFPSSWSSYTASGLLSSVPHDLARYGDDNVDQRRLRINATIGGSATNYDAQVVDNYARALLLLHKSGLSTGDRTLLVNQIVRSGMQAYGNYTRGGSVWASVADDAGGGAGQCDAGVPFLWYTALMFENSTLLAAAKDMDDNMEAQSAWIQAGWEGQAVISNENGRASNETFFSQDVGMPFTFPTFFGSNHDTDYGAIGQHGTAWYNLAVAAIIGAPTEMLRGGAFNSSNAAAASLAFLNRYRHWTPWALGSSYDPGADFRDMYDVVWPLTGLTAWTGVPDQPPTNSLTLSTPANGQIGIDMDGLDHSNGSAITQRDARVSLDGVQWVESSNVGDPATLTGLLRGIQHYVSVRARNAIGIGKWSANFGRPNASYTPRNTITTTGTESAAPAFDGVDPAIHARIYPAWWATIGNYAPASGTLAADEVELAAGLGYPSGNFAVADYSFQWNRDGSPISGATSQTYTRSRADAASDLTCDVTIDNGVDTPVTHTTTAVTCPALTTIPATTLFDTTLGWEAVIDYEESVANAVLDDATCEFDPTYIQTMAEGETSLATSAGTLFCDTLGNFPKIHIPPHNPALANKTYDVEIEAIIQSSGFEQSVDVVNGVNGSSLIGGAVTEAAFSDVTAKLMTITATIVTGGTPPTLYVRLANNAGTAGGGSLPRPSKIVIKEQV